MLLIFKLLHKSKSFCRRHRFLFSFPIDYGLYKNIDTPKTFLVNKFDIDIMIFLEKKKKILVYAIES